MSEAKPKSLHEATGYLVQYVGGEVYHYADYGDVVESNYYNGWTKKLVAIMRISGGTIHPPEDLEALADAEEKALAEAARESERERREICAAQMQR